MPRGLRSLFLKPSLACTARCRHCESRLAFYRTLGAERLTLPEYRRTIREARALGARALHLSGGEPTLYHELPALVREGREQGLFVVLNTNGSRIDAPLADALLAAGLDAVILSLHGATAATHDAIKRRRGSFDEVLRSVEILAAARSARGARCLVTTQTIVSKQNFRELSDILGCICDRDVDAHGISYLEGDTAGGDRLDEAAIAELRAEILPAARARLARHRFRSPLLRFAALRLLGRLYAGNARRRQQLAAGSFEARPRQTCRTPRVFAMVLADGSVLPCNMVEYSGGPVLGNVRRTALADILGSDAWRRFAREGYASCRRCPSHLHFHIPISVSLGALLGLVRRNPAEEQKSVAVRVTEALGAGF